MFYDVFKNKSTCKILWAHYLAPFPHHIVDFRRCECSDSVMFLDRRGRSVRGTLTAEAHADIEYTPASGQWGFIYRSARLYLSSLNLACIEGKTI